MEEEKVTVKKKSSIGSIIINILVALIFLIGAGILTYPSFSDMWNKYRQSLLISSYEDTIKNMDTAEYDKLWAEAKDYNKQHTVNNIVDAFDDEENYVLEHPYDRMLNFNSDGIMGYITIPKINVKLAIYHGTGADVLEKGIGHIQGTSLPIGGKDTHSVLSGHRGLPSALLLTDLDQVTEGDVFYINVLDKILEYQVDQILTVLPEESQDLAIVKGQDYLTLVTCTPYAVNTHRLLVRGTRIPYDGALDSSEEESAVMDILSTFTLAQKLLLAGVGAFVLILIIIIIRHRHLTRKRKKNIVKKD